MGKKILDTTTKAGLDALKTSSKRVVYKAAKVTGELMGNKIAEDIVKPKLVLDENSRNVKEIVIPPEKKKRNTTGFKTSIIK